MRRRATLLKPEWHGVILGAAVYVGFYYDREHGEGQRARGWIDVPPLLVSGVTSLVPLAVAADTRLGDLRMLEVAVYLAVLAVGLLKPVIWFAWWHVPVKWSADPQGLWVPTRAAAVTWGLVMAATVITIS